MPLLYDRMEKQCFILFFGDLKMIFFVLILLLLICSGAEFAPPNKFAQDYISKDKTSAIKGIFVALILFSHGKQYMTLGGVYDDPYLALQGHLGQMVVAMFLFYSGYGLMESIKRKGYDYVRSIPLKRFPSVLLNFDIAIVLYLILGLFLGKRYGIKTILLSLIGWESVGNSNWYMFAIFALYILTFLAFFCKKFIKWKHVDIICIVILTALTVAVIYAEMKLGRPSYWYNTMILFVLGFYYSCFKNTVEKLVMKNDITYFLALLLTVCVYIAAYGIRASGGIEGYTLWAVAFTLLVVLLTMKISVNNQLLVWLGQHVFSVYILQRIPMSILQSIGLSESNKYAFLIISIAATLFLAAGFDSLTAKLSGWIWKEGRKTK